MYNPQFGMATVSVRPGVLSGTGNKVNASGPQICVNGDEDSAVVSGCAYIAGPYSIPGVGTLSITQLGSDQLSKKTKSGGKTIMLKGTTYNAKFQVNSPAQMPTPDGPKPDPTPQYAGTGTFMTTNMTVKDKG